MSLPCWTPDWLLSDPTHLRLHPDLLVTCIPLLCAQVGFHCCTPVICITDRRRAKGWIHLWNAKVQHYSLCDLTLYILSHKFKAACLSSISWFNTHTLRKMSKTSCLNVTAVTQCYKTTQKCWNSHGMSVLFGLESFQAATAHLEVGLWTELVKTVRAQFLG